MVAMQEEIESLKIKYGEKGTKEITEKCKTAIFGGFSTFKDFEEVKRWVQDKFWEEWLPQLADIYFKGDVFKGIFFCRFETVAERDKVVENIRRLFLKIQNEKVWSAEDLPLDVRIPEHFLFGLKKLFSTQEWGYDS